MLVNRQSSWIFSFEEMHTTLSSREIQSLFLHSCSNTGRFLCRAWCSSSLLCLVDCGCEKLYSGVFPPAGSFIRLTSPVIRAHPWIGKHLAVLFPVQPAVSRASHPQLRLVSHWQSPGKDQSAQYSTSWYHITATIPLSVQLKIIFTFF